MINGEPILLGGKGETASIFVTGLTETDTVTASKDGKTWRGVWGSKTSTVITPLIPTLTGTSSSVFNTATHSSYASSFPSWHIFDDNDTSEWIPNLNSTATSGTAYVGYDIGTSKVAKYYRVYNHDGNYYDFKVQASNDNSTWVDLTSYISVSRDTEYYNSLNNTTAYRYYRLYLNKTGSGEFMRPAEFQVYGEEQGTVYGHIINKINSYGTYTVTATNQAQTETVTKDVLIDVATDYEIPMSFALLDTDFDQKESGWITGGERSGYPINFGNGVYVSEGWYGNYTEGTGTNWNVCGYLDIPISASGNYKVEWSDYVYTSSNSRMGGVRIKCFNGSTWAFGMSRFDSWASDQVQVVFADNNEIQTEITRSADLNGQTINNKIEVIDGYVYYYFNDATTPISQALTDSTITKIRILFFVYSTSYNSPLTRVNFLKVKPL